MTNPLEAVLARVEKAPLIMDHGTQKRMIDERDNYTLCRALIEGIGE